jgi:GAF domain
MSDVSTKESTPPPDLSKEREEVLRSFRKSAALTERFMDQYAKMRDRLIEVELENHRLRSRLAGDATAPSSRGNVEFARESTRSEVRILELEEEFAHLASLFVAGTQLQASLTTRAVLRRLRDILGQLVGARAYAVFFLSSDASRLLPVVSEGVPVEHRQPLAVADSMLGRVMTGLTSKIDEDSEANELSFEAPPAVIPLMADDRAVGVISIFGLLPQKTRFTRTDFELFRLLGQHAAPALIGASLFEQSGHKLPGAESIEGITA